MSCGGKSYHFSDLPPCQVCGDKGSGYHYGANTCEACKGFFRRSAAGSIKYKCAGFGKCSMTVTKRAQCQQCRYLKCLAIGMSMTAINRGRYTHEKRTRNISELKKLKDKKKEKQVENALVSDKQQHIENTIQRLTELFDKKCAYTPDLLEKLPKLQSRHKEEKELQKDLFGGLGGVCDQDDHLYQIYILFTKEKLKSQLLEDVFPTVEYAIRKHVYFIKHIPGFTTLEKDDQVCLLKASKTIGLLFTILSGFNVEDETVISYKGEVFTKEDLFDSHNNMIIEQLFKAAIKTKKLELDKTENILLHAIGVLNSEYLELKDKDKVDDILEDLSECLRYHVKRSRSDDTLRFARLLMLLYHMSEAAHWHQRAYSLTAQIYPDIAIPELLTELFSS